MPPIDDPFGTPAGGGNGSPPDDRTMIMPRPGGRAPEPAGGPRGGDPYTPPPMASLAPLSGRGACAPASASKAATGSCTTAAANWRRCASAPRR